MLPTNPLLQAAAPAGPHLPVALLRQYAAGTLAPAAQHRVEAHTLACPRCADVLEGLLQTTPATTDQALAQLQQRLRQRVLLQSAAAARPGRARREPRWLVLQLAAAAALLLGLVAGGWWAWQQRHAARVATTTVPAAAVAPLPLPDSAARALKNRESDALSPTPLGGYATLYKQLRQAATAFMPVAPSRALAGTVQLRLTIDANGKVQKINVLRSLRADYDAEAQRLLAQGPAWVPGTSHGRCTTQTVDIAVPF